LEHHADLLRAVHGFEPLTVALPIGVGNRAVTIGVVQVEGGLHLLLERVVVQSGRQRLRQEHLEIEQDLFRLLIGRLSRRSKGPLSKGLAWTGKIAERESQRGQKPPTRPRHVALLRSKFVEVSDDALRCVQQHLTQPLHEQQRS
jgi:hypothetical protein